MQNPLKKGKKITVALDEKTYEKLIRMSKKMNIQSKDLLEFFCEIGFPAGWNVKLKKGA
jgi:predicted DNA-binding antitoxin AbrB/MazE fold protein